MAIVRHASLENNTGAVLTTGFFQEGHDCKVLALTRKFAAIDVGTQAGKTQHAEGCLVGTLDSGVIQKIISLTVQKENPFANFSANKVPNVGIKIGADKKSLVVREETQDAVIAANDTLELLVLVSAA